jgi:hypothetical protein
MLTDAKALPRMKNRMSRDSGNTISDALWMSVYAGMGSVFAMAILLGGAYLFEPAARMWIDAHPVYVALGTIFIFVAGFGMSLAFAMELQYRSGKWE